MQPEMVTALDPASSQLEDLSDGGFARKTRRAAVWQLDEADSFSEALSSSLEFAGPAKYCPVLVGVIRGARWGRSSAPAEQLAGHLLFAKIDDVGVKLASYW